MTLRLYAMSLQEYSYDAITEVFDLFKTVLPKVIKTITTAVITFKELISTVQNRDFNSIISGLVHAAKQMVHKVTNLRQIGMRIYKAVGKFVELPPVITRVTNMVAKVTSIFRDINNDVMKLYKVSVVYHSSGYVSFIQCDCFELYEYKGNDTHSWIQNLMSKQVCT